MPEPDEDDDGSWPVAEHNKCPHCGRFCGDVMAYRNDERGWITAWCGRCGRVQLEVVGWRDAQGNFA